MAKATSISDVNFSQHGEQQPPVAQTAEPAYIPKEPEEDSVPEEKEEWVIFKLVKHKKGGLNVDGCDDVLVDGKTRRIWLLNGVESIWAKDLGDVLKDKDFMRTNRRSLRFINGVLRIPSWDKLAIQFARATRHNVGVKGRSKNRGNKHAFYEYNPVEMQKELLAVKMVKIKAITEASTIPYEQMKKHALFLGVVLLDDLGREKTEDGIRAEYMVKAEENPDYWNKTKGSPEVDRMYLIRAAINDSKIDMANGTIRWSRNGGFICSIIQGKSPQDSMLDLAMSPTPEGKAFLQQLQTLST